MLVRRDGFRAKRDALVEGVCPRRVDVVWGGLFSGDSPSGLSGAGILQGVSSRKVEGQRRGGAVSSVDRHDCCVGLGRRCLRDQGVVGPAHAVFRLRCRDLVGMCGVRGDAAFRRDRGARLEDPALFQTAIEVAEVIRDKRTCVRPLDLQRKAVP